MLSTHSPTRPTKINNLTKALTKSPLNYKFIFLALLASATTFALVLKRSKSLDTCTGALNATLSLPTTGKNFPTDQICPKRQHINPKKTSSTTSFGGDDMLYPFSCKKSSSADEEIMDLQCRHEYAAWSRIIIPSGDIMRDSSDIVRVL